MANIKLRRTLITSGGWNAYTGPGVLLGAVFNHDAASSGNVITIYDSAATSTAVQLYTRTSDTDAGTTVPLRLFTDGDLVAGTSTANVHLGIPFAHGVYLTKTGDTTHQDDYSLFIKPLIRKLVSVTTAGSAGSASGGATVWSGPGVLHGWRILSDTNVPSTADITLKDSPIVGSGNTVMTKTNYGFAAVATRPVVTTTGSDEGGTGVTTAATGGYANDGILLTTGLNVNVAQGNAQDAAYQIEFLIEA